jgi:hypothetical protein
MTAGANRTPNLAELTHRAPQSLGVLCLKDHCVHRAVVRRRRIQVVHEGHSELLVGYREVEAGEAHFASPQDRLLQMVRSHRTRHIGPVQTEFLQGGVVHGRRRRVPDRRAKDGEQPRARGRSRPEK